MILGLCLPAFHFSAVSYMARFIRILPLVWPDVLMLRGLGFLDFYITAVFADAAVVKLMGLSLRGRAAFMGAGPDMVF